MQNKEQRKLEKDRASTAYCGCDLNGWMNSEGNENQGQGSEIILSSMWNNIMNSFSPAGILSQATPLVVTTLNCILIKQ